MSDMHNIEHKNRFCAAWLMLLLLLVGCVVSVYTLVTLKKPDVEFNATNLIKGAITSKWEKQFDNDFLLKQTAIDVWAGLRYGLFSVGNKGVIVGKNGWLYTTEEFDLPPDAHAQMQTKVEQVRMVHDFLKARNITLVVAVIPAKSRIYPQHLGAFTRPVLWDALVNQFVTDVQKQGVHIAPLTAYFEKAVAAPDAPMYFMQTDTHWSPIGATLAAKAIRHSADGLLTLDTDQFVSQTESQDDAYAGDLSKFVPLGLYRYVRPDVAYHEPLTRVTRQKQGSVSDASDLFGDASIPVTLVGTSYSFMPEWDFDGALREQLGVDVLNLAMEGKGPIEPMAAFLKNTDWSGELPKIVIWEIPERFIPTKYDIELTIPAITQ